MFKTLEEAKSFCKDNGITMLDFKMTDINGAWRHITLPVDRLDEDMMIYGVGFDGSNYGYAQVENSDMVFIPDLSTAAVEPYTEGVLTMTGDVMIIAVPNNKPFDQYPRNVAKRAVEYMKETGIADTMIIGPEFEFHVFDEVSFRNDPHHSEMRIACDEAYWATSEGTNGHQIRYKAGYHADIPHDVNFELRNEMCRTLENWGVKVKYHHHEVGSPAQEEIETEMGEMTEMADKTMIVKYVIRNEAERWGKSATFMPKPVLDEAGNGMHVHIILTKDGKPLFYDPSGYAMLSDEALWFIGGMLKHAASLCALTNPSTNSFKRLVPGFEAPVTIGYATANRSAVVRIPAYAKSPMKKRFELRNPDATCNPYYAYSAILMAGLDGIKNKIDPHANGWGPYDFNLFDLPEEEKAKIDSLPRSLDDALDALEKDHEYLTAGGVFPERLIKQWITKKRAELKKINRIPNPAEFEAYYSL